MLRTWCAIAALALTACDPLPPADPALVEGFWDAVEICSGDCAFGVVEVYSATGGPLARDVGAPAIDAPVGTERAPKPVLERTVTIERFDAWRSEAFGDWSRYAVDGGVVLDDDPIGLSVSHDREGWYQGNRFRSVAFGRVEIGGESFCVGADSAATIRRRATCEGPRHRFFGTLEVNAVGVDCEQPASGRLFIRYDEPLPECESDMDHSSFDDC